MCNEGRKRTLTEQTEREKRLLPIGKGRRRRTGGRRERDSLEHLIGMWPNDGARQGTGR